MPAMNCGRCHACGDALTSEEWCASCRQFRRYFSHGWNIAVAELTACEDAPPEVTLLHSRAS
jgi:hypothetical protein